MQIIVQVLRNKVPKYFLSDEDKQNRQVLHDLQMCTVSYHLLHPTPTSTRKNKFSSFHIKKIKWQRVLAYLINHITLMVLSCPHVIMQSCEVGCENAISHLLFICISSLFCFSKFDFPNLTSGFFSEIWKICKRWNLKIRYISKGYHHKLHIRFTQNYQNTT